MISFNPTKYAYRFVVQKRNASTHIKKVLIANRGEIACRVARTAKKLGIQSVAVYSDADVNSLHVSVADEAYHIGPALSSESYLRGDKLLTVAKKAGCQAVHPGYGFLSENAVFAEECKNANIVFIGPPPSAIRDMGCKSTSKKIMEAAGVPVVKGYHGDDQSDAKLKEEAEKIGYPVMLKALKGGGGKGMRIVMNAGEFDSQLASARNEASKAFGDTAMLVEAFVTHPRHVEVQVFGDTHGNYVHVHERDCSVQRRHQKVLEEAPAPGLPDNLRKELGEAAVRAARAVGYYGAGTVEFILDADTLKYYFMEMNTRLQVEHPITEMISGTDLVEWQFKVASGEKLGITQDMIPARGHAFEARVYAEDPTAGFLPQAGTLKYLGLPVQDSSVRVDTGVRAGDEVPVFYDPLIAKLVVWGKNRTDALQRLEKSLVAFRVSGVPTNVNFLLSLATHPSFVSGDVHTNFIEQHGDQLLRPATLQPSLVATAVSAIIFEESSRYDANDPFYSNPGFRVNLNAQRTITLQWQGANLAVKVEYLSKKGDYKMSYQVGDVIEEFHCTAQCKPSEDGAIHVETRVEGDVGRAYAVVGKESIQVFSKDGVRNFEIPEPSYLKELNEKAGDSLGTQAASPMPGVVDQILVAANDVVKKGQALVTVIAMKMEYTIKAPNDGIVEEVLFSAGASVAKGAVLVRFKES